MSEEEHRLRVNLGERIRTLREQRGLSREQLAARCDLTTEVLARFEEGHAAPAIGELARLAPVLEVDVGSFFAAPRGGRRVEIVRATERWDVEPRQDAARTLNYRYQALSYGLSHKAMSPFLVEIPPQTGHGGGSWQSSSDSHSQHAGEEFLFVLSGQLEAEIAGESHRLGPGDSIYFDSSAPHTLRAAEGAPVRLLACIAHAAPTSSDEGLERAFGGSRG